MNFLRNEQQHEDPINLDTISSCHDSGSYGVILVVVHPVCMGKCYYDGNTHNDEDADIYYVPLIGPEASLLGHVLNRPGLGYGLHIEEDQSSHPEFDVGSNFSQPSRESGQVEDGEGQLD